MGESNAHEPPEHDPPDQAYPNVACPFCDPALGARLLLIGRVAHPEHFWTPRSYWRHLQEMHTLPCAWVMAHAPAYLRLRLTPDEEERMLLHLGECKGCHGALLRLIAFIGQHLRLSRDGSPDLRLRLPEPPAPGE